MFIEAILFGIIIGLVRRGKMFRLSYADFNMPVLIYISAVFYIGIVVMNLGLLDFNTSLYTAFLIISYILIILFLFSNIEKKFMFIPLIGLCLNLLCFIVNDFKFPISSDAISKYYGNEMLTLLSSGKMKFFIPSENAVLSSLGNMFPVNKFVSVSILSAGDILIAAGILLVVQAILTDRHIESRNKITFSKGIFK